REGVEVRLKKTPPLQVQRPPNHGSARDRLNVLRKNIRKEQDAGRYLVLDKSLLEQWLEIVISSFGVVEKGDENAAIAGRTIHDLSFPEGTSINDCTDQDSIIKPDYAHCDAVASEILRLKRENTGARICVMADDVASAFHNIGIHSNSVYLFAGHIEEDDFIVIELAAPFGWTESPGFYEIASGAIAHIHGSHTNGVFATGFFNYHLVDDHINVAADIGTTCDDMDRSLWFAIVSVLGADAINNKKFTNWDTRQRVLGLEFDSVAELVSMPTAKVEKARCIVAAAHTASTLSRKAYRSLMGSLQYVATCIRTARPFLQRLRQRESRLHRFQSVTVTDDMRQDLLWWRLVLHTPHLNGVSLEYFNTLPSPDIVVEMDASDYGLCALDAASQQAPTYQFSGTERSLIAEFKNGEPNSFNINFRELLSCAFTVHAWRSRWGTGGSRSRIPCHVHFRIDNTSAVAWQNKLASRNTHAQVIIRLLSWWEASYGLRFSASHIAGVDNERADAGSHIAANPSFSTKFASLTPGWLQVSPAIDVQGLTDIWLRISELTPLPTPHAIKRAAIKTGKDSRHFSSHSLRAGDATHMYRSGTDALTIQFHGRWMSDAFKTYTRLCKESVATLSASMVSGSRGDSTLH
ncbi:hypothetical protein BBO99_00009817, partial [Phytophthora kernoviae]